MTSIQSLVAGQKLVITSIALSILNAFSLALATNIFMVVISIVVIIAVLIMGIMGISRLAKGLGYSTIWTIVCLILMFVPLVSLLMLLVLNARATKELKAAGYKVGLLGARPRSD